MGNLQARHEDHNSLPPATGTQRQPASSSTVPYSTGFHHGLLSELESLRAEPLVCFSQPDLGLPEMEQTGLVSRATAKPLLCFKLLAFSALKFPPLGQPVAEREAISPPPRSL